MPVQGLYTRLHCSQRTRLHLAPGPMSWHGHLSLDYRLDGDRTIALDRHHGPLRVLQRLYPESPRVCHHVLVHPPGGIVGGDVLAVQAQLQPGTHALITTPGAARFYRSAGPQAHQTVVAQLQDDARLEWLPLETIAYRGCRALNELRFELAPRAEMMGWDVLALGLPAAGEPFDDRASPNAWYTQSIELPGIWLEKGTVRSNDHRLLDSPLGWAGHRVMGTLWFASGSPLAPDRREALLDQAREPAGEGDATLLQVVDPSDQARALEQVRVGATGAHDGVVVVRVLGHRVEPVMQTLTRLWARWRPLAWHLPPCPPRVWRM